MSAPGGRLVLHAFAALAEFIREPIVIGTNDGLAAARARVGGRRSVATEEVIRAARDLLPDPGRSITSIAKLLGVSPGTLYNQFPLPARTARRRSPPSARCSCEASEPPARSFSPGLLYLDMRAHESHVRSRLVPAVSGALPAPRTAGGAPVRPARRRPRR
ncbi:hypothetical protein [Streptomyces sp. HNM0645]|uniref:hypothetical protein n=1 Tax=Streptomyces sp. HNM0645 TaxID=2782343 RepID=UPI0032D5694D